MVQRLYEFSVVVAGPGDANPLRRIVIDAIEAWNLAHSAHSGLRMQPIKWEDVRPALGADAQSFINESFADRYSALIATFKTRLGKPTPRSTEGSGTVEEIELAIAACDDVMVYFYTGSASLKDLDAEELARLQAYKKSLRDRGLLGGYRSNADFRRQIDQHLAQLAYKFQRQVKQQGGDDLADGKGTGNGQGNGNALIKQSGRNQSMSPLGDKNILPDLSAAPDVAVLVALLQESVERQAREDRESKQAILEIASRHGQQGDALWIYNLPDPQRAEVRYHVRNTGRAMARDISARVVIGQDDPNHVFGARELPPHHTTELRFILPLSRPFPGGPDFPVPADYPDSPVIRIALMFTDDQRDLGEQVSQEWCFRFSRVMDRARWVSHRLVPCPDI